jgi:hypothetical protein
MNAIPGRPALVPALDLLALRRAAMQARLIAQDGTRFARDAIALHIRPGATEADRLATARLLLAGTGFQVTPKERAP